VAGGAVGLVDSPGDGFAEGDDEEEGEGDGFVGIATLSAGRSACLI